MLEQVEWRIIVPQADVDAGLAHQGDPGDLLVPVEAYASQAFSKAFENPGVIAGYIPYDTSQGSEPRTRKDLTAYYGRRKKLTPEAEKSLYDGDQAAQDAIKGVLSDELITYVKGEVVPDQKLQSPSPDLPLNFTPNSMSACIWNSREHGRAGAAFAPHEDVQRRIGEWFYHSAIDKLHVTREPGDRVGGAQTDVLIFRRYITPIRHLPIPPRT